MNQDEIIIRGAKEHNLKNIDVTLPRFRMIAFTGVSGSGKSSLAFDTLYAEGQRRYVESLSAYARQFIGQMEKPKVDFIGGLSPAIAIEQKAVSKNPRSTVATVTEIYDYLRVLYARIGTPHCPECGREVHAQSAQEIVEQAANLPDGERIQVLAPLARNRKGTFQDVFNQARADGFSRVRVDGEVYGLDEKISPDKKKKHNIELVVDRLVVKQQSEDNSFFTRLTDSVETALRLGDGLIIFERENGDEWLLSEHNACPICGASFPELSPAMFSFNSPLGMCPECNGLGVKIEFNPQLFVDPAKSLHDGGVRTWGELRKKKSNVTYKLAEQIVGQFGHDLDTPWQALSEECQNAILYGGVKVVWQSSSDRASWQGEWEYEGTLVETRRRYRQTKSEHTRRWYASFMGQQQCPVCNGQRLRPESAAVTIGDRTINQVTTSSIAEALDWIDGLRRQLSREQIEIGDEVLKEIHGRLLFLMNVGLYYLTLDRPAPSLSGGEGQRIRLASQIGCGLVGVLYVLDEPSIGLH
ncbi:MAG: excinuclease ABC subunit UvrA, partial [Anaerolineales bacterium]|nr:excinuclease ABC subunit UvrA [Anaerolineales bacterium]